MSEKSKVFYSQFTCLTVRNGGWLIVKNGGHMELSEVVAAFTNTRDFLAYLANHIAENGLERVEKNGGAE